MTNDRCPCGCGILLGKDDEWMTEHFDDDGFCRLCRGPVIASVTRKFTLPDGSRMHCPLCAYYVALGQLRLHAEMLVAART